jgi:adenine-specific DNA-methyltransferase
MTKRRKSLSKQDDLRMDGRSMTPQTELLELLREKAPEIFVEGRIDPVKLKQTLGEEVTLEKERYGLNWAGKSDCFRHIQEPTTATLKPCRDESVDFDTTENLFIEGDNLQVLKTLQKSYYGRVKMIYIDPPYNTGNDTFIYPDRFQETQDEYLQRIGDKDAEGNMTTDGFWRKNSKDAGHFHSNWLSMMYPRLFLAKNLLRPDGVIFVSIDDNEVHNLRMVMNEIFGEENFLASIVWQKKTAPDARMIISSAHDYILAFTRNYEYIREAVLSMPFDEDRKNSYSNPDNDSRGDWASVDLTGQVGRAPKSQFYKIKTPSGETMSPPEGRCWALAKRTFEALVKDNRIWFGKNGDARPRLKKFLSEAEGIRPWTWWDNKKYGHNQEGNQEVKKIFNDNLVFDNPKPTRLIKSIIQLCTNPSQNEIILDFFAGSGTTAHATWEQNISDSGNRKFILVQLQEKIQEGSNDYKAESIALKAGYKTIADIGKERIRRAADKIKKEQEGKLDFDGGKLDLGFKVFKLDPSNFKIWRSDIQDGKALEKQLSLFVDNVNPEAQQDNILYELILKSGLDLNVNVEAKKANGEQYFVIEDGKLILCLEEKITEKLVEKILSEKPEKVICLDRAFAGNDQLKTNTALQMEAEKIEFKVI